ncbi:MAG: SgcJ/EcaC family oxidoreductase [Bryobacteraceae bacterium]|jgi:uncharacterized protein (TIGR02246 family)
MSRWCSLIFLLSLLPSQTFAQHAAQSATQSSGIRVVMTQSEEAWNRGDLPAFAAYYDDSPETTFVGKEVVRGGVQAILARYRKAYPTRDAMGTLSFSNLDVRMLTPDLALVTGEFHLERTTAGGGNAAGRYTLILRKRRDGWKIIHDHTSS